MAASALARNSAPASFVRYATRKVDIEVPPLAREEQAIKPFFTEVTLAVAARVAEELGGRTPGQVWLGPGMRVRNVCDPEGKIVQLRESTA